MSTFPLVDLYMSARLDVALSALNPGAVKVVESPRRLRPEQSYGFIHALWWVWLTDGRSAASVPPSAKARVGEVVRKVKSAGQLLEPDMPDRLRAPVDEALRRARLPETERVFLDLCFACNACLLRRHSFGDCRRLVDESIPPAEGLKLPTHCFPDGVVYGVLADGEVASTAFAHRSGVMEDRVADLGIVTAPAYRRRGYAKTAVSAVVEHIVRAGGEALYACRPDNAASVATAASVGFVPYGSSLVLSAAVAE